jgi:predicted cupin superfamily sugar epimerase
MLTADELISFLKLEPHPKEGGHFRETYRASELIEVSALPARYGSARAHSTAIYYLLTQGTFSALHRLDSDEIFHFYLGDPVEMLQLMADGSGQTIVLGPDLLKGQHVQVNVPRGVWQGSRLVPGGRFALLGCTVAPGFDYADYEGANRQEMLSKYPTFANLVTKLTPD